MGFLAFFGFGGVLGVKLFKSGSTADRGVKQVKSPFEGVMIEWKTKL